MGKPKEIRGALLKAPIQFDQQTAEKNLELTKEIAPEEIGHWLESDSNIDSQETKENNSRISFKGKEYPNRKNDSATLIIDGVEYEAELSAENSTNT